MYWICWCHWGQFYGDFVNLNLWVDLESNHQFPDTSSSFCSYYLGFNLFQIYSMWNICTSFKANQLYKLPLNSSNNNRIMTTKLKEISSPIPGHGWPVPGHFMPYSQTPLIKCLIMNIFPQFFTDVCTYSCISIFSLQF